MLAFVGSYHRSNSGASLQNNHLLCETEATHIGIRNGMEREERTKLYVPVKFLNIVTKYKSVILFCVHRNAVYILDPSIFSIKLMDKTLHYNLILLLLLEL